MLPLRRFFSAEANSFGKLANNAPTAADVLYRNPGGIRNRMQLFHLFRLRTQLKLDIDKLKSMARSWEIKEDEQIVRMTTRIPDNHPGIESQFDPAHALVSVSFPLAKLNLSKNQEELLLKLVGERYCVDEGMIKFDVGDFPLKEQNQKRAMEIIRDLLAYVKSDDSDKFEDLPLTRPKSRIRSNLAFPKAWLPPQQQ